MSESFEGIYIGIRGYYAANSPFDSVLDKTVIYECIAVRNISELVNSGIDVLSTIYTNNKLTEAEYELALSNNTRIIILSDESGQSYYIPSNYITKFPLTSGVSYADITLGVALGPISEKYDFSALEVAISNLVKDYIGVTPEIKPIQTSASMIISYDDHSAIETTRANNKAEVTTDSAKLLLAQNTIDSLYTKINELEKYIKEKIA